MANSTLNAKIESFWKWFVQTEDRILTFFSDEVDADKDALIETINNKILDFGLFSWEIGPDRGRRHYLTISPNGDKTRLEISKLIISKAPRLRNWSFYYAKPSKKWDFVFKIYDDFMMERTIEAFRWNYVLLEYADDTLEIQIEANNISFLDQDYKKTAADLVITNILGEEAKIKDINKITIVEELDDEYSAICAPIRELKEHFEEILAERMEENSRY
ncbi:MAG: hypothetical protein R2828_17690 [Saprospiraceae bacterium]